MQARPERCADCAAVRPIWGTIFGVVLNCAAPCIAQSRFHTPHHGLSTFRRQGSILVAAHLVFPWNTELRNFSFLGSDQIDNLLKDHI